MSRASKTKKPIYKKLTDLEHVLARPDMYIGSVIPKEQTHFVVVDDEFHIEKRTINMAAGLQRIMIEPLSNVIDNVAKSRQNKTKLTKICIDVNDNQISIWNDGDVIPVELHPVEKIYNHTLLFSQFKTGSNYDDSEDRIDIGGKNGIGATAAAAFSSIFTVKGVDPENKKKLVQTWKNNLRDTEGPKVTPCLKKDKGYTKVTFTPDFQRFGETELSRDALAFLKRLAVDVAMITKLPTFFDGEEIPVTSLKDYAKLFKAEDDSILHVKTKTCEVVVTPSASHEFEAISFANGVSTFLGGVHVNAWTEALFRPLVDKLNKPKKPQINLNDVKKFYRLFVTASVVRPVFDAQTKTILEGPEVEAEVKKSHILALTKWPLFNRIEDLIRYKEMAVLKKTERKKRGYEHIEGLEPANFEGGKKSLECTLILVEGLSAKTYAVQGIKQGAFGKSGRDYFGIFPLRGVGLNCRTATPKAISENPEIPNIIKALGLQYDVDYSDDKNFKKLRYGKVMILTDADVDGLHISGLIQNMFHALFPSLLKREPPFLVSLQTPVVRVFDKKQDRLFYSEEEFVKFAEKAKGKLNKKYYKGLGSNNEDEVDDTFGRKIVQFREDEKTYDSMRKAFDKDTKKYYTDMRKEWLTEYDPSKRLLSWKGNEPEIKDLSFSDFIDTELIKFSIYNCKRAIPSVIDGLKQSQRKVLYGTIGENLKYTGKKTLKVSQLAGYISAKTAYHHGEKNLNGTIVNMAQAFVGSNNIPMFFRDGQFGTRLEGGADAADGRYIWTKLDMLTRDIFRPEDEPLLDYLEDDGETVEPKFYVPIIPMILVNGASGMGTGWSTDIPCYNPEELIGAIKGWLDSECYMDDNHLDDDGELKISPFPELTPWYRGFKGEITKESEGKFITHGIIENSGNGRAVISELPIGKWTSKFTEFLEKLKADKAISSYKNHCTHKEISYTVLENEDEDNKVLVCDEKNLKLTSKITTTNMVAFDSNDKLKRYPNTDEIIDEYCRVRYAYYVKRKAYQLKNLEEAIKFLGNKKRFLEYVRDGEIKLFETVKGKDGVQAKRRTSRKTADVVKELEEKGFDKELEKKVKKKSGADEDEDEQKNEQENSDGEVSESRRGYDYLLRMQISSITAEKITKLQNEIDSKIKERDQLQDTAEKDIWNRELDDLLEKYRKFVEILDAEKVKGKQSKKY